MPLTIFVVAIVAAYLIKQNPPTQKRGRPSAAPQMNVEVEMIKPKQYQIILSSFGTVRPRTQSELVAQVSGQIKHVSPNFREGGFFEKGEVLLQLDDRDYKADLDIALATLSEAEQGLLEEQAQVDIASEDWKRYSSLPSSQRLTNSETPSALLLRGPHLEAAKARVLSAQAQVDKAKLALERSSVIAPFAGRVLVQSVDVGQVVTVNTNLATVFAVDFVDIRLPLNNADLPLIDLPEEFRNVVNKPSNNAELKVTFRSELDEKSYWHGSLVRTESAIDSSSQQLYVVAQIDDPYALENESSIPLKIGQYVTAEIQGKLLSDAIVIPNSAIYQGSYVYIVEEGVLKRKDVSILWHNETDAVISNGLNINDQLVMTALGQISSGTPVAINGEAPKGQRPPRGGKGDRQQHLQRMAEEQGISVAELMERRKKQRSENGGQL
ncbi:efflux RND transporter periplasmic adaptor subunit [Alteromonas sp. 5E99-2]|nr:efflux RND transporter periplasmic adaptor subunit [Alteromonas sp. 5E99-2]